MEKPTKQETMAAQSALHADGSLGFINVPVHRSSTVIFDTADAYLEREGRLNGGYFYGLYGTPARYVLETEIAKLEGGSGCLALQSATAAVTVIALHYLKSGSHVLLPKSAYFATNGVFKAFAGFDVDVEVYETSIGAQIETLIRPETALIWLEAPGSFIFDIPKIDAICEVARKHSVLTCCDATWATPLGISPLNLGCDFSLHSATKYIGGASEVSLGTLTTKDAKLAEDIRTTAMTFGIGADAESCSAILRGLRSLPVRLKHQSEVALELARRLEADPRVSRVRHPALSDHPDHALFQAYFTASSGLFSFSIPNADLNAIRLFASALDLIRLGAGWGGPISLIALNPPSDLADDWIIRLSVGFEDIEDLWRDLSRALSALADASTAKGQADVA